MESFLCVSLQRVTLEKVDPFSLTLDEPSGVLKDISKRKNSTGKSEELASGRTRGIEKRPLHLINNSLRGKGNDLFIAGVIYREDHHHEFRAVWQLDIRGVVTHLTGPAGF